MKYTQGAVGRIFVLRLEDGDLLNQTLEAFAREAKEAVATGEPLALLVADIDHFKRFNDTHGHDQGDRVLQMVARVFRETLRRHDVACRYGGEEFVGILPSTPSGGALRVAERLRCEIADALVDGLQVTVSLGVATAPELPTDSSLQLVELADRALYRAKRGGRNQVCVASAIDTAVADSS